LAHVFDLVLGHFGCSSGPRLPGVPAIEHAHQVKLLNVEVVAVAVRERDGQLARERNLLAAKTEKSFGLANQEMGASQAEFSAARLDGWLEDGKSAGAVIRGRLRASIEDQRKCQCGGAKRDHDNLSRRTGSFYRGTPCLSMLCGCR
jgi:hypothetical protein